MRKQLKLPFFSFLYSRLSKMIKSGLIAHKSGLEQHHLVCGSGDFSSCKLRKQSIPVPMVQVL